MEPEVTITTEVYYEILSKMRYAIQNLQHGVLMSGIVLIHDSVHPHTSIPPIEIFDHQKIDKRGGLTPLQPRPCNRAPVSST